MRPLGHQRCLQSGTKLRFCLLLLGVGRSTCISISRGSQVAGDEPQLQSQRSIRLVRIQKTGGNILGDVVMRRFCAACHGNGHEDWTQARTNGSAVISLLRDPVERSLSEFFWLRKPEADVGPDWHFHNESWLSLVRTHEDVDYALEVFLHGDADSPSRNRQTLYLLGFHGDDSSPAPGAAYDWDTQPGKYVRWAMEHLEKMPVYGITDCWLPSMRAIARQLGWNVSEVEAFAAATTPDYGKHDLNSAALAMARAEDGSSSSWRAAVSKERIKELERINKVDLVVYRKALKRFVERFGEACSLPYEPFGPVIKGGQNE